jgi:hypothetical protein
MADYGVNEICNQGHISKLGGVAQIQAEASSQGFTLRPGDRSAWRASSTLGSNSRGSGPPINPFAFSYFPDR